MAASESALLGPSEASVISSTNPMPETRGRSQRESFEFRKLDFSRWPWLTVMSICSSCSLEKPISQEGCCLGVWSDCCQTLLVIN